MAGDTKEMASEALDEVLDDESALALLPPVDWESDVLDPDLVLDDEGGFGAEQL